MRRNRAFVAAAFLLLCAAAASAQVLTGSIIGTIRDESGAVLPGATVTLTSPAIPAGSLSSVSDAKGEYRFTNLLPGTYSMNVTLQAFTRYDEKDLRVVVNGTIERSVVMKLGSVTENVTVSGASPLVDVRRVGLSTDLTQDTVDKVPTRRFSVFDYMKWTPGVSSNDPSGKSTAMSTYGSGTSENNFQMDGINFNSPQNGVAWQYPDPDVVAEVESVTLGASAEYSAAQGAVFSVITKSGTNNLKADGSYYYLPDKFVSKPITLPCGCPQGTSGLTFDKYRDTGIHVGGPIKKNKVFFFAGYQYNLENESAPGTDPAAPTKYKDNRLQGKLTWQMNDSTRLLGTFFNEWWNIPQAATIAFPTSTRNESGGYDPTIGIELNKVLNNTTNLVVRFTGWYAPNDYLRALNGDTSTPNHTDYDTGYQSGGTPVFGFAGQKRQTTNVKLTHYATSFMHASHDFKFGIQTEFADSNYRYAYTGGVRFYDISGEPYYAVSREPYVAGGSYKQAGGYAEDQVTIHRVTISVGGRYDHLSTSSQDLAARDLQLNTTGQTIRGLGALYEWNEFVARVGFNYRATDDGKTIIRGNYGRSYRPPFTNEMAQVHPGLSPIITSGFDPATGAYSVPISVVNSTANLSIDSNTKPPYTDQYSIGMDREVMPQFAINVTYVRKNGDDLIGWTDIGGTYAPRNVTLANGQMLTALALTNRTSARQFLLTNPPAFFTRYNGLILGLQKRWSQNWQINASYTLSRAEGLRTPTSSGVATSSTGRDPNDLVNATGDLPQDRRHAFSLQGAFEVPRIGVLLASSYQLASGLPYAPQAVVRLPQGTRSINIAPPQTNHYPRQNQLMLRVSKIFRFESDRKIELVADMQNLLQSETNLSVVTRNFFSANFGVPNTWIEPRRLMVGIKFAY